MPTDDERPPPPLRYVFAHIYLRDAVFEIGVWRHLYGPRGAAYLQEMWHRCAEHFPEEERTLPDGLGLRPVVRQGKWLILPIVFPLPLRRTDAYFAAIAIRRGRLTWTLRRRGPTIRYLTLERGTTGPELQELCTMIGEWTPEGHVNYGDGPPPFLPGFLECLKDVLAGKVHPTVAYKRPDPAAPEGEDKYTMFLFK